MLQFVKLDLRPGSQFHFDRNVYTECGCSSELLQLPRFIEHGGWLLNKELAEVLEFDVLLANVANTGDKRGPFAMAVDPFLAHFEAQARLQAADFLAPGGECCLFGCLGDQCSELLQGFLISDDGCGYVELANAAIVAEQEDAALREVVFLLPELAMRRRGLAEIAGFGGSRRDAQFVRSGVCTMKAKRNALVSSR